jgi:hypothetical protein
MLLYCGVIDKTIFRYYYFRSEDRILGGRFSVPVQAGLGAYPATFVVCTGSFPAGKVAGA